MNKGKNTSYIFTFGNLGVGKSTLMASACAYVQAHQDVRLRKRVEGNPDGLRMLLVDWLGRLKNRNFPPQSRKGQILQIDVAFQTIGDSSTIRPLTFLEMSGEDLQVIDIRNPSNSSPKLGEDFEKFLKLSDVVFIVTSVKTASEDDLLIDLFFEWMEKYRIRAQVALVVSKWDEYDGDLSVEKFVLNEMPSASQFLVNSPIGNTAIFPFSIGKPDNDNQITNFSLGAAAKIVKWMGDFLF